MGTHLGGGDVQLDLAVGSGHEGSELLADTLEGTETVVLGKGLEEVLEDIGLVSTSDLLELLDDLSLVGAGQGRSAEDGGQLLVGLDDLTEGSDSLSGLLKSGGLGRGSVLQRRKG